MYDFMECLNSSEALYSSYTNKEELHEQLLAATREAEPEFLKGRETSDKAKAGTVSTDTSKNPTISGINERID